MILFREDWDKYPGAIVDTKTFNPTFIRYSALLKEMGVKNYLFPLQLHNRDLRGINPFDPYLDLETQTMISLECKANPFYFFRELARVPGSEDDNPDRFRANRGNMALYWLFFNHITTILIQIRQTGKSFSTDMLMTYLLNLGTTDTEMNLLTKDETLRSANLERLKEIESELPYYVRMRTKKDLGNTEELSIKALNNRYRSHLPNKSPKMALNVGRGLTSPIFQIDEAAFFYNISISLPAALAAGTAARDKAKRKGKPYGTILTTTAGKKDDRDGAYIFNMVQESAVWNEKFLDAKNATELESLVRHASSKGSLRVNCTFNHRQLGYTDAWLKQKIEEAEVHGEAADRDFGNVWTSGSQTSPLDIATLEVIRNSEADKVFHEIQPSQCYVLRWFIPENDLQRVIATDHYIAALDTSDAAGDDDIALVVRSVKTGEVVAAGNYNETNLITYAMWIVELLVRIPNMTLIIERRSTGSSIIDYLLLMLPEKGIDPTRRLYNKIVQDSDVDPERYKKISGSYGIVSNDILVQYKKTFGFSTSGNGETARKELYGNTLLSAAKMTGSLVRDKKLIDQILSLVVRNGRVDHPEGGHDDMCVAWLLSYWVLLHGKNLKHYGINPREILVNNQVNKVVNSPENVYKQMYQDQLRQKIVEIVEKLKYERDDFIAMRLEGRLIQLNSELTVDDQTTLAADDLIHKLRDQRRQQRISQVYGYQR